MAYNDRPALGVAAFVGLALLIAVYLMFAAVQGDFGILERTEIEAERHLLETELDALKREVTKLENLTRRLSDTSLDLDLLDEQARDILGVMRPDEIAIH
ncbi:MAG: septum formation initiator family protein [Pseudomonadota bacterium]